MNYSKSIELLLMLNCLYAFSLWWHTERLFPQQVFRCLSVITLHTDKVLTNSTVHDLPDQHLLVIWIFF